MGLCSDWAAKPYFTSLSNKDWPSFGKLPFPTCCFIKCWGSRLVLRVGGSELRFALSFSNPSIPSQSFIDNGTVTKGIGKEMEPISQECYEEWRYDPYLYQIGAIHRYHLHPGCLLWSIKKVSFIRFDNMTNVWQDPHTKLQNRNFGSGLLMKEEM